MRRFAFGVALLVSIQASAGIYKTYDKNGNPVFSDDPSGESEPVETRETMVVPSLPVDVIREKGRNEPPKTPQAEKEPVAYTLDLLHPAADEVIPHGAESYMVEVKLEPSLWKTHHLEIWLDGARISRDAYSTKLNPLLLDRGQHRIEARVLNARGAVVNSTGRNFHIQHPSVLRSKPAKSK